jgi:hypothetical protein
MYVYIYIHVYIFLYVCIYIQVVPCGGSPYGEDIVFLANDWQALKRPQIVGFFCAYSRFLLTPVCSMQASWVRASHSYFPLPALQGLVYVYIYIISLLPLLLTSHYPKPPL